MASWEASDQTLPPHPTAFTVEAKTTCHTGFNSLVCGTRLIISPPLGIHMFKEIGHTRVTCLGLNRGLDIPEALLLEEETENSHG